MKLKRISIYITGSAILMHLLILSCQTQRISGNYNCIDVLDVENTVYQMYCYKNDKLEDVFYVDKAGKKVKIFNLPDIQSSFFTSEDAYYKFIQENLIWKTDKNIEGRIILALYIDEAGSIIEKRVVRDIEICPECTISALRLVDKFEIINPAYKDGEPVKSLKTIIIPFR